MRGARRAAPGRSRPLRRRRGDLGLGQSPSIPYLLPGSLTVSAAAASDDTLAALLVVFGAAALIVVPALALLYTLQQRARLEDRPGYCHPTYAIRGVGYERGLTRFLL